MFPEKRQRSSTLLNVFPFFLYVPLLSHDTFLGMGWGFLFSSIPPGMELLIRRKSPDHWKAGSLCRGSVRCSLDVGHLHSLNKYIRIFIYMYKDLKVGAASIKAA